MRNKLVISLPCWSNPNRTLTLALRKWAVTVVVVVVAVDMVAVAVIVADEVVLLLPMLHHWDATDGKPMMVQPLNPILEQRHNNTINQA